MSVEELLAEQEVWMARFDDADRRFRAARYQSERERWMVVQDDCLENLRHYTRLLRQRVEGTNAD